MRRISVIVLFLAAAAASASDSGPISPPLAEAPRRAHFLRLDVAAEEPSPFGRTTLSVIGIGGQNFAPGRHGFAKVAMPTIDAGKFISRRIEVGLDLHPWIYIRQPVNDNGDGGFETVSGFAVDVYGRWYPAPFSWRYRPYIEIAEGPFYAVRRVPTAGSRFNLLTQFGAGSSVPVAALDPWSVVLGYRWVHISNAGTYRRNPSWNFWSVVFGLRKYVGGGSIKESNDG